MASASVELKAAAPLYAVVGVALVGFGFLVWLRFHQDPDDTSWLDPQQPPINTDSMVEAVPQYSAKTRTYPARVSEWAHSCVGDC